MLLRYDLVVGREIRINELDGQIEAAKSDVAEIDASAKSQPANPSGGDFKAHSEAWMSENSWYGQNQVMTDYIDTQCERFKGLPPEMYFKRLTEMAKTTFPEHFKGDGAAGDTETGNAQTRTQTVVGGQTRQTGEGGKKTFTFNDLTPEQKKMAQFYKRSGVMELQEYVDEQVKIGNIQGM